MQLSKDQKKYIRKHRKTRTVTELSAHTGAPEDVISSYIRRRWDTVSHERTQDTPAHQTHTDTHSTPEWTVLALVVLLIAALYVWTLPYAFISDDISYLVQNPLIKSFAFVTATPLTMAKAFLDWVMYQLFGLNPVFFRLLNVLFHIGTSWTLYLVVKRLASKRAAAFAAVLFAVHPLATESVTWIGGGGYPQYAFFFLLSFYWYLRIPEHPRYRVLSLAAFVTMLFSSEKSIPMSLAFVTYELALGSVRRRWKRITPYVVLSAVWVFLVLVVFRYAQQRITALETVYYNQAAGLYNPLIQLPVAITTYLELLVFPVQLSFYHAEVITPFLYIWKVAGLLFFLAAAVYGWKKNRTVFFLLTLFVISLSPSLSPLRIAWVVAERYAYLGTAALVACLGIILGRLSTRPRTESVIYMAVALSVIALFARTAIRNTDWQNQDTLWIATGKTAPADPKTHNNLGDLYGRRGDLARAELEFRKAIALQSNYADAYHNLGNTLIEEKRPDEARTAYENALKYNPGLWQTYQALAALDFNAGKFDEAIGDLKKAAAINPGNFQIYVNMGLVYIKQGDAGRAREALNRALSLSPDDHQIRTLLDQISK